MIRNIFPAKSCVLRIGLLGGCRCNLHYSSSTYIEGSILDISFACQRNRRNPQRSSRWLRLPDHKFCRLLPSSRSMLGRPCHWLPCMMHAFTLSCIWQGSSCTSDDRPWKRRMCVFYSDSTQNRRNQLPYHAHCPGITSLPPPPSSYAVVSWSSTKIRFLLLENWTSETMPYRSTILIPTIVSKHCAI